VRKTVDFNFWSAREATFPPELFGLFGRSFRKKDASVKKLIKGNCKLLRCLKRRPKGDDLAKS